MPETVEDDVLREARAALAANDVERASRLAETAVEQGAEHPLLLNLAAYRMELEGRYSAALDVLRRALERAPGDPSLLNSMGVCYSKSALPQEALAAFDAAIAGYGGYAPAHNGRGLALAALGDRAGAAAAYQTAASLDASYPDPLGGLATLAVDERRYDDARELAGRALALDPTQAAATLALAAVDLREGAPDRAAAAADRLIATAQLSPLHLAAALRLKGDALDGLRRYEEAFSAYEQGNGELRRLFEPAYRAARAEFGVEHCQRLIDHFEAAAPEAWRATPGACPAAGHAFLVGFPRSGTTLLEQVLASHPGVAALEEKPTLQPEIEEFFARPGGLNRLAALSDAELDKRRDGYWRRVTAFGAPVDGRLFVDKGPLNSIYLPLIAKLFPQARIIFAVRDPRDVTLSCFRRPFGGGPIVFDFTDLERTARLYDGVMRLATRYETLLDLAIHLHRHERLVAEFDAEVELLCGFLGLPYDAEPMRNFVETAERRDIRTPSAGQVRRGLNTAGIGHWRNYAGPMEAVAPILDYWVAAFGYEDG